MSFPKFTLYDQKHTLFSNFARFCTPKRCTRVQCLVLKNNPNYVNFWMSLIPPWHSSAPPPRFIFWDTNHIDVGFSFSLSLSLSFFNIAFDLLRLKSSGLKTLQEGSGDIVSLPPRVSIKFCLVQPVLPWQLNVVKLQLVLTLSSQRMGDLPLGR